MCSAALLVACASSSEGLNDDGTGGSGGDTSTSVGGTDPDGRGAGSSAGLGGQAGAAGLGGEAGGAGSGGTETTGSSGGAETTGSSVRLSNNAISDISALEPLTNLDDLELDSNDMSDFAPLVANTGGMTVDVTRNPVPCDDAPISLR